MYNKTGYFPLIRKVATRVDMLYKTHFVLIIIELKKKKQPHFDKSIYWMYYDLLVNELKNTQCKS